LEAVVGIARGFVVGASANNKWRKHHCRATTRQATTKRLVVVAALIDLHRLVGDAACRAGLRCCYDSGRFLRNRWCYCEKTDSDCVVEVVVIVLVMSWVPMMPAARVTALYEKSLVASVTV
jgi:hypothetical protein